MPKKTKELSALEVKNINRPGRHSVGYIPGLLLVVKESGTKSWILRTVIGGKRRNIGLGGFPEVSLAQAREKARSTKKLIEQGIDPLEQKRAVKRALAKQQTEKMTFSKAAKLCHEKKMPEFRSEKHAADWISSVNRFAVPVIGNMPVNEIELRHILKVLEPIWTEKTETATRLRQRIEHILSWATVSGHRTGDNPARWKGHLDAVLPKPSKVRTETHFPALPWREIGSFMQDLREREGVGARILEFLILTVARSKEVRFATWDEIDFENRTWRIPPQRTKTHTEHAVPLTDDAINILKFLPRFEGSPYVFPAPRGGALSDMTISKKIKDMHWAAVKAGGKGYLDPKQGRIVVPHGFRSSFRDWCSETTNFSREVAEKALGHAIGDEVEAAYRRGDLFEKRRRLMEAWANYCNKTQAEPATVTPIREEKKKNG